MLGPGTGREVSPEEVKVRLRVSAAELAAETGLSDAALQHILAVAGNRCGVRARAGAAHAVTDRALLTSVADPARIVTHWSVALMAPLLPLHAGITRTAAC